MAGPDVLLPHLERLRADALDMICFLQAEHLRCHGAPDGSPWVRLEASSVVVDHLLPLLGGDTSPGADQDSVVVGGVPVRMFRYSGGSPQFGVLLGSSGLLPSRKVYVSDLSDPAHEVFCCLRRDGVSLSDAYDAAQDLAGVSA